MFNDIKTSPNNLSSQLFRTTNNICIKIFNDVFGKLVIDICITRFSKLNIGINHKLIHKVRSVSSTLVANDGV